MRTSKADMLAELRRLLHDVFVARAEGCNENRLARAHGYVDGYMRALLESGHATKQELLELVALARARVSGPATRELAAESAADIAAA
jgi:alkylhydroperoxidase/carboxymuconolactone decarboxylase family protein YurZ